jgi:hypothetical protein
MSLLWIFFCPACIAFLFNLSRHSKSHNSTSTALCGTIINRKALAAKMENGMLVDLRERRGRDRLLFTYQTTVSILIILITTLSCSKPDMLQPSIGVLERETWFSDPETDATNSPLVERKEARPKVRRAQPRRSASPKVATVHAPKAPGVSVSRSASKKANTPSLPDAKKEQLFREFQEWQRNHRDLL